MGRPTKLAMKENETERMERVRISEGGSKDEREATMLCCRIRSKGGRRVCNGHGDAGMDQHQHTYTRTHRDTEKGLQLEKHQGACVCSGRRVGEENRNVAQHSTHTFIHS